MSESILITHKDKEGIYSELLPQIESIISQETDIIANQANISAILKEAFKFLWVGFYRVDIRTMTSLCLVHFKDLWRVQGSNSEGEYAELRGRKKKL
jgi:putative methionine-R-sulfoxide reductase with GAF domain